MTTRGIQSYLCHFVPHKNAPVRWLKVIQSTTIWHNLDPLRPPKKTLNVPWRCSHPFSLEKGALLALLRNLCQKKSQLRKFALRLSARSLNGITWLVSDPVYESIISMSADCSMCTWSGHPPSGHVHWHLQCQQQLRGLWCHRFGVNSHSVAVIASGYPV